MRRAGRKRTRVFVSITATCERRSPETDRLNGASMLTVRRPQGPRPVGHDKIRPGESLAKRRPGALAGVLAQALEAPATARVSPPSRR
jgi:hypothetical protein